MEGYRDYSLGAYFTEKLFHLIVRDLNNKGICTIGQYLDNKNIIDLKAIEGVGVGKIDKFNKRLDEIINGVPISIEESKDKINVYSFELSDLSKLIKDVSSKIVVPFELDLAPIHLLDYHIAKTLVDKGINTLGDLKRVSYLDLFDLVKSTKTMGYSKTYRLFKRMYNLTLGLDTMIEEEFNYIKDYKHFNILYVKVNGKSLSDIAKTMGLTRERVRQIYDKAFDKLSLILYALESKAIHYGIIKYDFRNSISQLESISQIEELNKIFVYYVKNNTIQNWTYYKSLDLIFVCSINANLKDLILSFMCKNNNHLEKCRISAMLEEFKNSYSIDYLNESDIVNLLINFGYIDYNKHISKNKLTLEFMVEFCINKYFKEGININRDLDSLKNYVSIEFGGNYITDKVFRNIKAYIDRSENIIFLDAHTKIHLDNLKIPENYIKNLGNTVESILYESDVKYCEIGILYDLLLEEIPKLGRYIKNKYILHGVLNKYYSGRFKFKRFNVSLLPMKSDKVDLVYDYLSSEGGNINLDVLSNNLKIHKESIVNLCTKYNKLVIINSGDLVVTDKWLMKNISFNMKIYIDSKINDYKYCNSMMVFSQFKDSLKLIGINSSDELFYVLKALYSHYYTFVRKYHILNNDVDSELFKSNNLCLLDFAPQSSMVSKSSARAFLREEFKLNRGLVDRNIKMYENYIK